MLVLAVCGVGRGTVWGGSCRAFFGERGKEMDGVLLEYATTGVKGVRRSGELLKEHREELVNEDTLQALTMRACVEIRLGREDAALGMVHQGMLIHTALELLAGGEGGEGMGKALESLATFVEWRCEQLGKGEGGGVRGLLEAFAEDGGSVFHKSVLETYGAIEKDIREAVASGGGGGGGPLGWEGEAMTQEELEELEALEKDPSFVELREAILSLPEGIRKAILAEDLEGVRAGLDAMEEEERARVISLCSAVGILEPTTAYVLMAPMVALFGSKRNALRAGSVLLVCACGVLAGVWMGWIDLDPWGACVSMWDRVVGGRRDEL